MKDVGQIQTAHRQLPLGRKFAAHPTLRTAGNYPVRERLALGRSLRQRVPRSAQAEVKLPQGRDPVRLVVRSSRGRVAQLLHVRYGRMAESPFTFLRGSAMVMAEDLAGMPRSGPFVQACGDAHLCNFGGFATRARRLAFDLRDFDETHPAPWEWDVKRLSASIFVAGRQYGHSRSDCRQAVRSAVRSYREHMLLFAEQPALDVWYSYLDVDTIARRSRGEIAQWLESRVDVAKKRTSAGLMPKLTRERDGETHIVDDPPVIIHIESSDEEATLTQLRRVFDHYATTLPFERRILLNHFHFVDFARKVVGVGSVGTRCFIALFMSADGEPLFLQAKQAGPSVLEAYTEPSRWSHFGERVVRGQRQIQAQSDVFLGWTTDPAGHQYYVRQLRDMKVTADVGEFTPSLLDCYGRLCGWALARAHARTGDPALLAGYLGRKPVFDKAVTRFAEQYAEQNEMDYEAFVHEIRLGRIQAARDV